MRLGRRRFLTIAAVAAVAAGAPRAQAAQWRGRAFGADLEIRLDGPLGPARTGAVLREIAAIERTFSLHDPASELCRLNRGGRLRPSEMMAQVLALADAAHARTGGLFDPTVQVLWEARAEGRDPARARADVGWARVEIGARDVRLGAGQALTLNGIVQGYAADRIRAILAGSGPMLVDMGEYAAQGRPFRVGLEDPAAGLLGAVTLGGARTCLAVSSPDAYPGGHIFGPAGEAPQWSTVAILAASAAEADALSTAACLMPRARIAALCRAAPGLGAIVVDRAGNLERI